MAYDKSNKPELTEELKGHLKTVVDHFEQEDSAVRIYKLRKMRRLKLYWNNISNIYWSETARDYRVPGVTIDSFGGGDQDYYDRPLNVFKAFIETVIAALSIEIPGISCSPDDADNPLDQSTAKAGDKISELLYKHNDAVYMWLHALYISYTEGMIACYQYEKTDKKYGTYDQREYEDEKIQAYACPHCAARLEDAFVESYRTQNPQILEQETELIKDESEVLRLEESDEYAPDDDDIDLHADLNEGKLVCPECAKELDPELQKSTLVVPRFVGMTKQPKSRVCFDLFGELYVKIADYAKKQEDTPYLIYSYETNYVNILERYKDDDDLWNKLPKGIQTASGPGSEPYEQYSRMNVQYRDMYPDDQVTVREAWLRPAAFNILDREVSEELHDKFPDGCKVVVIEDLVAEACNENLDDCWTLTKDPLADFLSKDPDGDVLVNVQDIVNDLISLILQTIEHGIPQTWADPAVVNFDAYGNMEATPGAITPTKIQGATRSIGEAFFSTKASALSPEVFSFYQIINQLGQFLSAAMPSIFGGSQESGSSRTASEYAMSRTASLQRLQTKWRMLTIWWKTIYGKAIPAYIKLVKDDERYTQRQPDGNYINVFIRRAEIQGKLGDVELEAADGIPISDEQKADWIIRLMELNNQEIAMALMSPDNFPMLRKVIKIPEFKIPGEDDRQKQYEEIQLLIAGEPVSTDPDPMVIEQATAQGLPPQEIEMMAQPVEMPSIMPDELVDDHLIEAGICRSWLVSLAGRLAKQENEPGYRNVLLHMKAHMDILSQQAAAQAEQMAAEQQSAKTPDGKQKPESKEDGSELIDGVEDVRAPVQ